jgi:hypothetical protein
MSSQKMGGEDDFSGSRVNAMARREICFVVYKTGGV